MSDESASDPFAPPAVSTEVCCIHCGETYDSWQIEWRVIKNSHGQEQGFWCCPMTGCDGIGFGFDILPTDPNYEDENGGWCYAPGDDDEFDDDDEEFGEEFDDEELAIAEEEEAMFLEAEELGNSLVSDEDIPWDDPEPKPSSNSREPPGEDWPFSMN